MVVGCGDARLGATGRMDFVINFEAFVGKEVVVWPKNGQSFLLCEEQRSGIIPALVQETPGDANSTRLHIAPFVVGEVKKLGEDAFAVRYRMPSGKYFLMGLNPASVATVTISDPANAITAPSSLIIGAS